MSSLTNRYSCRALDLFAAAPMYEVPEDLFATTEKNCNPKNLFDIRTTAFATL
jgi:hypothetical protein